MANETKLVTLEDLKAAYNTQYDTVSAKWSSSTTYNAGDYCIYEGKLWRCKVDGLSGNNNAPVSGDNWANCSVTGQINQLRECVAPLYAPGTPYKFGDYVTYDHYFWRRRIESVTPEQEWNESQWDRLTIADSVSYLIREDEELRGITNEFLMPSKNMFNIDNPILLYGYFSGNNDTGIGAFVESQYARAFVIPIKGGKSYTITRKNETSRFSVGTSSELHLSGTFSLGNFANMSKTGCSAKELHTTASSSAKYMYVWFYRSTSDSDYSATLEEMMVTEGTTVQQYEPYDSVVKVTENLLEQDIIDDIQKGVEAYDNALYKTYTAPATYNLFDVNHAEIINYYINDNTLISSVGDVKTFVMPAVPGKTYTVTRKNSGQRFFMGFGTDKWNDGENHALLNSIQANSSGMSYTRLTLTAPSTGEYLYVFYYNGSYDDNYSYTIEEMMVVEGSEVKPYVPYSEDTKYVMDDIQKGVEAYDQIAALDRWESRKRIYGVEFNNEYESPLCERIADAKNVTNFDNIYPWCDMRRCAVTIENGKKTIVYEGESGYSVNGSAGNVMVEIPAFYVCRERIGTTERWMISGTQYGGFELHPWFINSDGSTVTHRYIGAYIASDEGNEIFSVSGSMPYNGTGHTVDYLADKMRSAGYNRHNIYALSAIQFLFIVEYATRDSGSVFNGSDYNVYMMTGSNYDWMLIQTINNNTLKLGIGNMLSGNSFLFYSVGMQVAIGTSYDDYFIRNITAISHDNSNIYITVDGASITLTEGLRCGGISQKSGKTDTLTTPSGYAIGMDSHVASFRYRGIENIWGCLWEILDGIKIKNGVYYITHDFTETNLTQMEAMTYPAPMISAPDHVAYNWIKSLGYDVNNRTMILPETLFTDNGRSITLKTDGGETVATVTIRGEKYFGNPFASSNNTSITMFPSIGGGWDHHENSGLFTFRFMTSTGGLYGERLTC